MNYCLRAVAGVDSMAAQDALLRNNWDHEKATEDLKKLPPKSNKRTIYYYQRNNQNDNATTTTTNGEYSNGNASKKQRKNDEERMDDSDEHEYNKYQVRFRVRFKILIAGFKKIIFFLGL